MENYNGNNYGTDNNYAENNYNGNNYGTNYNYAGNNYNGNNYGANNSGNNYNNYNGNYNGGYNYNYNGYYPPQRHSGMAVASLVMGIITMALCLFGVNIITGILGIIFGAVHIARHDPDRRAMAMVGLILSIIGIALFIIFIVFVYSYAMDEIFYYLLDYADYM